MMLATCGILMTAAQTQEQPAAGDAVRSALERLAQAASVRLDGAFAQTTNLTEILGDVGDDPRGGWMRQMAEGTNSEGTFSAVVGTGGDLAMTFEMGEATVETFRRGERTIRRRTWAESAGGEDPQRQEGAPFMAMLGGSGGGAPPEAERMLSVGKFAQSLSRMGTFEDAAAEEIGGRNCRAVTATVPADVVEAPRAEEPEAEGPGQGPGRGWGRMMRGGVMGGPVESARMTFFLDPEDGSLRMYRVEVERGAPSWFEMARQYADFRGDFHASTVYEVEIRGAESGPVRFPPEIERRFE